MTPIERTKQAATRAATQRLADAATFAELHICKPLFQKIMRRPSCPPVMVGLVSPGILIVADPKTGELLARSLPGNLRELNTTPTRSC